MLMALCFSACSSDDQQVPTIINNPIKQSEIEGVWTDGNSFMSFNTDGYYAAYLENNYLGCGTYTLPMAIKEGELHIHQEDSIIEIGGDFGRTIIHVLEISDKTLKVNLVLPQSISMTLHKTADEPLSMNQNQLCDKRYEFKWAENDTASIKVFFLDENTAIMTSNHKDADVNPLFLRYILIGNKLYFVTYLLTIGELPTGIYWNGRLGNGNISIWELSFGADGNIESHKVIIQ